MKKRNCFIQKAMTKRLRIFAGPNGSGKTTLFDEFSKKYHAGYFINADKLEQILKTIGFIDLDDFSIKASQDNLQLFLKKEESQSLIKKAEESRHNISLLIQENRIIVPSKETNSYECALIAMFLREKLIEKNESFCFETVMSHYSKIEEIYEAKKAGYKTYLYFICIDDFEVNISRIENRVKNGGHRVAKNKVKSRYSKTLKNLFPAITACNKSYLFDNSGKKLSLIAEIQEDSSLILHVNSNKLPQWFNKHVMNHYS
jgi:predicted ABC-type ATPase